MCITWRLDAFQSLRQPCALRLTFVGAPPPTPWVWNSSSIPPQGSTLAPVYKHRRISVMQRKRLSGNTLHMSHNTYTEHLLPYMSKKGCHLLSAVIFGKVFGLNWTENWQKNMFITLRTINWMIAKEKMLLTKYSMSSFRAPWHNDPHTKKEKSQWQLFLFCIHIALTNQLWSMIYKLTPIYGCRSSEQCPMAEVGLKLSGV